MKAGSWRLSLAAVWGDPSGLRHRWLIAGAVLAGVLVAVPPAARWAIANVGLAPKAGLGCLALIALACLPWRFVLLATTVEIIFEGALRKWVWPGSQQELYALKYVMPMGAYLRFFIDWAAGAERIRLPRRVGGVLLFLCGWVLVEAANPSLPAPWMGFLGIVHYLGYVPLLALVPRLFRSERQWLSFLIFHFVLGVGPLVLGIVQVFYPVGDPINIDAWGSPPGTATIPIAVPGLGSPPRPSSTFPFVSAFSGYVFVHYLCTLVLMLLRRRLPVWVRWLLLPALILEWVNLFLVMSRGLLSLAVVALLLFGGWSLRWRIRGARLLVGAFVVLAAVGLGVARRSPIAAQVMTMRFISTVQHPEYEFLPRLTDYLTGPLQGILSERFLGRGAGATSHVAGRMAQLGVGGGAYVPLGGEAAEGYAVGLELGWIGLVAWYLLKLTLAVALWREAKRHPDAGVRAFLLAPLALNLIGLISPFQWALPHQFYFWWFTGWLPWAISRREALARRPT